MLKSPQNLKEIYETNHQQRNISDHVGKEVSAGEIIESKIDMIIGNDITTPISIKQFERSGATKLANPDGFAIVMDHYIPTKDILSANQAKISREFAYKHDLKNYFDEKIWVSSTRFCLKKG